jgi:pimeloyl-ACP methyl ester carboxylesterase
MRRRRPKQVSPPDRAARPPTRPSIRVAPLEGAARFIMLDQPERFRAAADEFLARSRPVGCGAALLKAAP